MLIYLQQFLSQAGIASRRQAIELIKQGKVKVNNQVAQLGLKIDPSQNKVKVNNQLIKPPLKKVYYLVNKPIGYTCTLKDKFALKKVTDLVPPLPKVWPVGRLDKNSHGLIILTNDGQLTHQLTHPSFRRPKEYLVMLDKKVNVELLSKLEKGVKLKEGMAWVDQVKKISPYRLSLVVHQGWNRQIRRMLAACGYQVIDLQRIRIGKWRLGSLKSGAYKPIKISYSLNLFHSDQNT